MKKIYKTAIVLFLAIVLMSACDKTDLSVQQSQLGLQTTAEKNAPVIITDSSGNAKVTVEIKNISDSRCPKGVVCFWPGDVKIQFIASSDAFTTPVLTVKTPGNTLIGNSVEFRLGNHSFRLLLTDVKPYPIQENTDNNLKKVEFILTEI